MENNEIMVEEIVETEVVENFEEVEPSKMSTFKAAGIGAAVIGAGYLLYKKVAKPAYSKFKAHREAKRVEKAKQCGENTNVETSADTENVEK